jgi:putative endonuclease
MAEHNELGKLGEEMAGEFFGKTDILFWRPIDFSKAEIDIIAQKENTLVVEVKTRSSLSLVCHKIL